MSRSMHDVGREIARAQDRALEARGSSVDEVRRRLFVERSEPVPRPSHAWRLGLALAVVALVATGLARETRSIARVESLAAGRTVHAATTERGTAGRGTVRFELANGSRLRNLTDEPTRTRLALEEGSAFFDVVHRDHAEVVVTAGPHRVRVVGTRFRVTWNAARAEGRVEVDRGRVEVTSPGRALVVLGAGQSTRLTALTPVLAEREAPEAMRAESLPRDATVAHPTMGATGIPHESSLADLDTGERHERAVAVARARATDADALVEFRSLVSRAEYGEAVAVLGASGFARVVQQGALADLTRLCDALRLLRDPRAGSALLALRSRFPGTDEASTAAFQLGRLQGEGDAAARFLAIYLEERPHGRFRDEALGRLLRIAVQAHDASRARSLAREYLDDQPDGPYAPLAREALGAAR